MLDISIDTNYSNYDAIKYYSYETTLQTPIEEMLQSYLSDLDATKLCKTSKGLVQIVSTNSFRYKEIVERFIRTLFRIPYSDYIIYNFFLDALMKRHQENIEFELNFNSIQTVKEKPIKNNKKSKVPNKYVRSETHNLFTGELVYDYTNFATGDSFVSSNPDLLEELNAPKKKKEKKQPRKEFGKILLKFSIK